MPNWWDTSEQNYFPTRPAAPYGPPGGIASLASNWFQPTTRPTTDAMSERDNPYAVLTAGQLTPYNLPSAAVIPDWLRNQNLPPGTSWGSLDKLEGAEGAGEVGRWVGSGFGMALGVPLMGVPGRAVGDFFGNRYINSHVFMNPGDTTTPNWLDEALYGATPLSSAADPTAMAAMRGAAVERTPNASAPMTANQMFPGSGSRMNASSGFIWGMGGLYSDPRRINDMIHGNKPGG